MAKAPLIAFLILANSKGQWCPNIFGSFISLWDERHLSKSSTKTSTQLSPILMHFTSRPNNSRTSTKQTATMLGAICVWLASCDIGCCRLKFEDGQSSSFMYLIRMHFYFFNIYIFVFLVKLTSSLLVIKLHHVPINNNDNCKVPGKQLQYFYATNRNISRFNLLRTFGQPVATCWHNGCCWRPYSRGSPLSYF